MAREFTIIHGLQEEKNAFCYGCLKNSISANKPIYLSRIEDGETADYCLECAINFYHQKANNLLILGNKNGN